MTTTTPKVQRRRPRRVVGIAPVHMTVQQREDMIKIHKRDVVNAREAEDMPQVDRLLSRIEHLKELNSLAKPA